VTDEMRLGKSKSIERLDVKDVMIMNTRRDAPTFPFPTGSSSK
jgi:hypothetical protein